MCGVSGEVYDFVKVTYIQNNKRIIKICGVCDSLDF